MPGALYEATVGRGFAAVYDTMIKATEEAGFADMRRELLTQARGTVVELGAGSGANLLHYTDAVERLVLTEPSEHMAKRLRDKLAQSPLAAKAEVHIAGAETLPVADATADTVVSTLVLCTVDDPYAMLREAARVLKPGGRLLFLEHVRSDDPGRARWQDRLQRPWRFVAAGCRCNRDTVASITASPLTISEVTHGKLPKALPVVEPLVSGSATRAA